jgi:hypothetical protein
MFPIMRLFAFKSLSSYNYLFNRSDERKVTYFHLVNIGV